MSLLTPVDLHELPPGNNLLQSSFWGEFKSHFGWRPHAFLYQGVGVLMLERNLPGGFVLAYLPHPLKETDLEENHELGEVLSELRNFLPSRTLCIRCDFPRAITLEEGTEEYPFASKLKKAVMDIQAPSTVLVSLEGSEDELLKRMKTKTRYNIRLSARRGVEVHHEELDFLPRWYRLYRETSDRDRIAIHSYEYYRKLLEIGGTRGEEGPGLHIISATHEGDLLASVIIAVYGNTATYMYGASSNMKRNMMASYAVQWEAMKTASAAGCVTYDLFGIPPADDPGHPMHGLYRFKTGFGGRIVHRPGAWDLPLSQPGYSLFRSLEQVRSFYFKKLKKR